MADDDTFLDDIDDNNETIEQEADIESLELAEKKAAEQAQKTYSLASVLMNSWRKKDLKNY